MTSSSNPLHGKVALVTGAGRGLGRAFAETLARLGCNVALHGMREHGPAEYGEGTTLTDTARAVADTYAVRTMSVLGDLTRTTDVDRVVSTVTTQLGPIDILVHNAGGDIGAAGGKPDPNDAIMVKEADVRSVLDRNLLSTILSIAGYGGRANGAIYATAKAGAIHYTRCLAAQLRPYNITANSIAPGDTRTGRFLSTRAVDPTRLVEGGTLERIALVDEVARAIEVFAGPTGDFITGQVLRVDGGTQCWPA